MTQPKSLASSIIAVSTFGIHLINDAQFLDATFLIIQKNLEFKTSIL